MKQLALQTVIGAFFVVVLLCLPATAQQPSPTALSLPKAIETALKENAKISVARSRLEAAQERIVQARSGLFPQVEFSESYNRTTNPMWAFGTKLNQGIIQTPDFNPDRLNNPDAVDNFASTFSVSWSLYDRGQTWFGWHQAKQGGVVASHMMERVRQHVIARTVLVYAGLLLARENLDVVRQTLNTARVHLKMVRSRFKSGFTVKSDLLRAQVHIADLEQQLLQSESRVAIARAGLNAAMGVPFKNLYELTSPLEAGDDIDTALDHWIDTALSERADYKQLQSQEIIARQEISKAKAGHFPALNLVGNYEINSEDFSDKHENYTLGAFMSLNLFSGRRLAAKHREAKITLREVTAVQRDLEQEIRLQTQQAFLQAQSAWKRIRVVRATVAQAEEALRIVRNRYNSGLLTIVELLDAETVLQQARVNTLKAIHDYRTAVVQLHLAAGTIDKNFI